MFSSSKVSATSAAVDVKNQITLYGFQVRPSFWSDILHFCSLLSSFIGKDADVLLLFPQQWKKRLQARRKKNRYCRSCFACSFPSVCPCPFIHKLINCPLMCRCGVQRAKSRTDQNRSNKISLTVFLLFPSYLFSIPESFCILPLNLSSSNLLF